MFAIVRVKWKALYLKSVLVKEYWHIIVRFKALNVALNRPDILLLRDKVQLLHPASQNFSVNLIWQVVPVLWTLEFKLVIYGFGVEFTLVSLASLAPDPLEPVVAEELFHLSDLLFIAVPLLAQVSKLFLTVCISQHPQSFILGLEPCILLSLFLHFFPERLIYILKLT